MRIAWYVSLVAQAILALTLWEPNRRNWFVRYLVIALAVSMIRIQFSGGARYFSDHDYWYAWTATEPLLLGLQFLAVEQATRGTTRDLFHIAIIMAISFTLWAILLTGDNWSILRRAALLLKQAGTFGCFSCLFIPAVMPAVLRNLSIARLTIPARTDLWMLSYFTLNGLSLVAAQVTITQPAIQAVSTVHLVLITCLFMTWTVSTVWQQFRVGVPAYVRSPDR